MSELSGLRSLCFFFKRENGTSQAWLFRKNFCRSHPVAWSDGEGISFLRKISLKVSFDPLINFKIQILTFKNKTIIQMRPHYKWSFQMIQRFWLWIIIYDILWSYSHPFPSDLKQLLQFKTGTSRVITK